MAGRAAGRKSTGLLSMILILCVVVFLSVFVISEGMRLHRKNQEYLRHSNELALMIEDEKMIAEELEIYRAYTKTREFAEWYAKEKMGLLREDEIAFKIE